MTVSLIKLCFLFFIKCDLRICKQIKTQTKNVESRFPPFRNSQPFYSLKNITVILVKIYYWTPNMTLYQLAIKTLID